MAPLKRLKERVDALHQQLSNAGELGDSDRKSLETLLTDVARVLDRDDESREAEAEENEHETLAEQLRDAAEDFEEHHPALTHAVGRVADALSSLGI